MFSNRNGGVEIGGIKAEAGGIVAPAEIALLTEQSAIMKSRTDSSSVLGLAVLGGGFVALGGLFASVVISGAAGVLPFGITRLIMGLAFSLGLILVVIAGAQLFTSDVLMVMAWASGRLRMVTMIRSWTIVWIGNLIGAAGAALLLFLAGHYTLGHAEFGRTALHIASAKVQIPVFNAFFLGILCNLLVCLATWSSTAARDVSGKVLAIMFPISAFVASGFEHCVANMFFIPYGLMIEHWAPESYWATAGIERPDIQVGGFLANLLAVTAGNWIGGAVFVGGAYWRIYRSGSALGSAKTTAT